MTPVDMATGAVATLFREVRVRQDPIQVSSSSVLRYAEPQTRPIVTEICAAPRLEFLISDTTTSSRLPKRLPLLPKRPPLKRPLPGRLPPRRLLSRRFSWRQRWFLGSTFNFFDPWTNACWRGMRGGGLGGNRAYGSLLGDRDRE